MTAPVRKKLAVCTYRAIYQAFPHTFMEIEALQQHTEYSSHFMERNGSSERIRELPKATQLISDRTGVFGPQANVLLSGLLLL